MKYPNALAEKIIGLEEVARTRGIDAERARVLRIVVHMVYNPHYFTAEQLGAIEAARVDLIDRICDPREGVNPFPTNEALVLLDAGEPWEPARYARAGDA